MPTKTRPPTAQAMRDHLQDSLDAWPQFDKDEGVKGADLVMWFAIWRKITKDLLKDPR